MGKLFGYLEKNKGIAVISGIVALFFVGVLYFGRQSRVAAGGQNGNSVQSMLPRNYPVIQQPVTGTAADPSGQVVAQNTIKLAIGVTLGGKGTVLSVDPGSRAEAAGLRTGDVINQINGR